MALVSIFIVSDRLLYETPKIKNYILNNNLFDLIRYSAHYHANVIIFFVCFVKKVKHIYAKV